MKEPPSFEQVAGRLLAQVGFTQKILIGGVLSFIPIVNLFAFGYLGRYAKQIRRSGNFSLPEWTDWAGLFRDGVPFLVVWLAYWVLPNLIGVGMYYLMSSLGVWYIGWVLAGVVAAGSTVLFSAALYRFQTRDDLKDLGDVAIIFKLTRARLRRFIVPALGFMGVLAIALPLYGIAIFIGFTLLIAYSSLAFRLLEDDAVIFRF